MKFPSSKLSRCPFDDVSVCVNAILPIRRAGGVAVGVHGERA